MADLLECLTSTLEMAQAGDRDALDQLLAAARPRLAAVALKMVRDRDDAEDVVQEALLKVWRYVGRFEGRAAFSTWLHRIVVNTALDRLRARRNGVTGGRPFDDTADPDRREPEAVNDETPEDLLGRAQVGAVVRGAMARLSPVHRDVLALRELDGDSYQEIAQVARCPVGTVMSRLHHARHRLAETLSGDGADLLPRAA
ncbi:MAG: sigma-70 family RNA polymerase sigma factor [Bacteroidota bacterium]